MPHSIERELGIAKPINSLARELSLNLFRTEQHLSAALDAVLRPSDLRLDEYNVLRILRGAGAEGRARVEIEQRMVHEPDRLLALLHKLKTKGLIEGSMRLTITAAGLTLLSTLDAPFEGTIEKSIGWVDPARLQTAIDVLEEIREHLQSAP
ncbi:hypothetical protein [Longimicrobium terrae]|uniref:MarR family transcriptional regulator n=1 Tax=Longimicrobium terrae TaxID=1639882 RepID=A0A841GSM2_9BACT|nr:hypothetical protein [Longimicrobium terrae]MBB4634995.1 hypothetical protein [Longimicrobium terrae]MBB6069389.1 hypothetical protein [Longimicrobium terrae]NNC31805.1 hypothetical protein [Longimicrobium terrae]